MGIATVGAVPVTAGGGVVTVGAVVVTIGAATGATARWTGGSVRPPVSGAFEAGAEAGMIGLVSEGGVERGAPREERRETGADGAGADGPWAAGGTGACGAVEGSAVGRTASAGLAVVGAPRPGRRVALRCTGRAVAAGGVVPGWAGVTAADGPGDPDGLPELVEERWTGADTGAGSPAGGCGCGVPAARCTGGCGVVDGIDVFVARWTGGTTGEGCAGCAVLGAVGLPGVVALRWTGGCWAPVGVLGRAGVSGCRFAGGGVGDGRWAAVGPSPLPAGRTAEGVPVLPLLEAGLTGATARWTGGAGVAGVVGRVTARWTGVPLGAVRSGADGLRSVAPAGRSCGAVLRWAGVPGAVPPLVGVASGEGDAEGAGVGAAVPPVVRGVGSAGAEEARCAEPPVAPRSARDAGAVREPAEVVGGTARCTGRSPVPLGALPDRGSARCTGVRGAASAPGAEGASPPGREAPEPELAREGASARGCCSGTARCTGEPVVAGSGAAADRRSPEWAAPAPRAGSGRVAGAGPDRGTARWTGVPDAVPPPDGEEAPWAGVVGVAGEVGAVGAG
ncbi:hypothetical protein [Streptomyces sp. WAC 04229]|uniref:hypothetical protein n=1 Tax=Streptomyces sp. WAC 04229 TaxID=2203206 RepID=UPI003D75474A